jgi:uncharacterized membrane protein
MGFAGMSLGRPAVAEVVEIARGEFGHLTMLHLVGLVFFALPVTVKGIQMWSRIETR